MEGFTAGGEIFFQNQAVISTRWPRIAQLLAESPFPRSAVVVANAPQRTLQIDGLHLGSQYDREREAEMQAAFVPKGVSRAWVYGPGLGDLPRRLLWRRGMQSLSVVLMNLSVTRAVLSCFDGRDWLADPRVDLLTAEEVASVGFPFAAVPPCLQLAAPEAAVLRDEVVLELATPFLRKKHGAGNPELLGRLEETRPWWTRDPDVAEFFGRLQGGTAIVAAAGPTLPEEFARIAALREDATLIAVDAAVRPLLGAGLRPDIVVSVDGAPSVFERFFAGISSEALRQTALVYFPVTSPQNLEGWTGPRFAAVSPSPLYSVVRAERTVGELFCAGSVLHPAVDLAVRMGAGRVILAGADFSFPGERSHAEGSGAVPLPVGGPDRLPSGTGELVSTTPSLRGYLRDLERYVDGHSEVEFRALGRRGAVKRGISWID